MYGYRRVTIGNFVINSDCFFYKESSCGLCERLTSDCKTSRDNGYRYTHCLNTCDRFKGILI